MDIQATESYPARQRLDLMRLNGLYRILLVDDNVFSRHTLLYILQDRFLQIVFHAAKNGKKCLQIMQDVSPKILFMDVHLPGEGGIAFCAE